MPRHKVEEITINAKTDSIENTFSKLALSLFDIVVNTSDIEPKITKAIILKSRSMDDLLYQFMKKFYTLANNELFILSAVKRIIIEGISGSYMLDAVVVGDKMGPGYKIKDIVKMVTDRNIKIKEDKEGTHAQINIVVERRDT